MSKQTNTYIVPKQLQIITVVIFIGTLLLMLVGQLFSLVNQLQYGQDAGPALRFLLTDTIAPIILFGLFLFILPPLPLVGRLFNAALLGILALIGSGFLAGLVGMLYTQLRFNSAVTQGSEALEAMNAQANILHYSLLALGYVAFIGLALYWRKRKLWG